MFSALMQLFAPPQCSGCRAAGEPWCAACAGVSANVRWHDVGLDVCTTYTFSGPVRRTIIDWKDERRRDAQQRVVAWFREGLTPLWKADPEAVFVPVPATHRSERRRGCPVLLDAVRSAMPQAIIAPWLVAERSRHDQVGLSRSDRQINAQGSMRWAGPTGKRVILVDDVLTSGATLRECARAMRVAGAIPDLGFAIAFREQRASVAGASTRLR